MSYKKYVYLLLCFLLPLLTFAKGDMQELLSKANQQYAKSQYKEAQASYQQIINGGYQSVALYFNMGDACYKNGDIPSALLYYEKAHRLAPGDEDINFNIQFVNQRTTDKVEEAPVFFLTKWWQNLILLLPLKTLSVISILFMLLASGALINYLFTRSVSMKKTSFYVSITLFLIGLFTVFMANRQSAYFDNHHQAIIFNNGVEVKSSPAVAAKTLFVLHEGTKVDMLDSNTGWAKIRLANGSEGWITLADVKEI